MSAKHDKPKVKFCWDCGRKLYGNHREEAIIEGEIRTLHHSCAERLRRDNYNKNGYP